MKLSLSKTCAGASFCYLEVKGVDRKLKMMLEISHKSKLVEAEKLGENTLLNASWKYIWELSLDPCLAHIYTHIVYSAHV